MKVLYGVLDKKTNALTDETVYAADDLRKIMTSLYNNVLSKDSVFNRYPEDFVLVSVGEVNGSTIIAYDKPNWLHEMSDIKQLAESAQ